jgi:hypothetical protein
MDASSVTFSCLLHQYTNSPPFMESEGLLLCSQESTTAPYPELEASIPSWPVSLRSDLNISF